MADDDGGASHGALTGLAAAAAESWDVVVVGTGFGGAMTALPLARAGKRVLLVDRARWVDRDASAWDTRAIVIERKYRSASPYIVNDRKTAWLDEAVGGASVFYGAASLRLRESDFRMGSLLSRAGRREAAFVDWPITYADLAPYYDEAEELLGVAGTDGDPTGPPRSRPFADSPPPFNRPARLLSEAAARLGLHPFPLPLAINFGGRGGRAPCIQCTTCDQFPCRIEAKNDIAVTVLPAVTHAGGRVLPRTVAARLVVERGRVTGVECVDAATRRRSVVRCRACVVSASAVASPALLLRSGLAHVEPNGRLIGRYLMRHCNGIAIGMLPRRTNPEQRFHKQVAITDYYHGPPGTGPGDWPDPWGSIQALGVPPAEYVVAQAPFPIGRLGAATAPFQLYALCIAHDEPNAENRVELHRRRADPFGLPLIHLVHHYSARDLRARAALYRAAGRILRAAGAWIRLRRDIVTFSHALGSCRFGADPARAVLDPWCRFFGVDNLFVVDGSFVPTSGAVNPSLTIGANALRVGRHLVEAWEDVVRAA
jgi:choline dehydrogenase-like flavoprotein